MSNTSGCAFSISSSSSTAWGLLADPSVSRPPDRSPRTREAPDQPAHRVLLHVFRHVEADQGHPMIRRVVCQLGLSHAGRTEKRTADRLRRRARPTARAGSRSQRPMRRLAVTHCFSSERGSSGPSCVAGDAARGDAAIFATTCSISGLDHGHRRSRASSLQRAGSSITWRLVRQVRFDQCLAERSTAASAPARCR